MSRHGQELAIGVRSLDMDVPAATQVPFMLLVAARRRHRRRPAASTVVLVNPPLVKAGSISPNSVEMGIFCQREHARHEGKMGGERVSWW